MLFYDISSPRRFFCYFPRGWVMFIIYQYSFFRKLLRGGRLFSYFFSTRLGYVHYVLVLIYEAFVRLFIIFVKCYTHGGGAV